MTTDIRPAKAVDIPAIVALFQQSVLKATIHDYDKDQRQAWATRGADIAQWEKRVRTQHFLLVERLDQLLGFGSISLEGYLDVLYVHHTHQGEGTATLLLTALETSASKSGAHKITTHASLKARPFFEKNGYAVVEERQNWLGDVMLINYRMEKTL